MRKETKKELDNILDCMSGADGGIQFTLFLSLVEQMDQKAEEGDQSAIEIIKIINNFSRLISTAQMTFSTPTDIPARAKDKDREQFDKAYAKASNPDGSPNWDKMLDPDGDFIKEAAKVVKKANKKADELAGRIRFKEK